MTEARSPLAPDPALLQGARNGEQEAMARLLAGLRAPVRRIALSITGRPDGAEDVTQEVLIRVARSLPRLRSPEAFPSWLYRMTRNASLDAARADARRSRRSEPLDALDAGRNPEDSRGPLDRLRDRRARALVRAFVEELPPRQRQILDLVDLQGYEPTEVAGLLELAPGSVRASLFKARRALRIRILESHPQLEEEYGS